MLLDQPLFEKEIRFFRINPPKKQDIQKGRKKSLDFIEVEERRVHEIIRQVLKDFQYLSGYSKEQLNMSEGQRVLRMNGIKYVTKEESILKKKPGQDNLQKTQTLKVQYHRSQTLTDPRYMLTMLGYTTKQKQYFKYLNLQCYKCPAYGIEVVVYEDWGEIRYVMIEIVHNYEGVNPVSAVLVDKLRDFMTEESYYEIDPYTLRPKSLNHGIKPEL